jgi:hypothetical protein
MLGEANLKKAWKGKLGTGNLNFGKCFKLIMT